MIIPMSHRRIVGTPLRRYTLGDAEAERLQLDAAAMLGDLLQV